MQIVNNKSVDNKQVYQYTLTNDFVAEFSNFKEAGSKTRINYLGIYRNLMNQYQNFAGYIWSFDDIRVSDNIKSSPKKNTGKKKQASKN